MDAVLSHIGYPALFVVSFLAATLIPLGSEWLLAAMLTKDFNPMLTVAVATTGNYLGACTTYYIGRCGSSFFIQKLLRIDDHAEQRAKGFYDRYGVWSLLFSWLPIVGDPMCLVGGVLRISFLQFSLLVFIGKCARYITIAWIVLQSIKIVNT